MPMNKKPKAAWADEPTPLCDEDKRQLWDCCDGEYRYFIPEGLAGDLERRLQYARRLVNLLRIDVLHNTDADNTLCWLDPDELEQRLSYIEEALTP